jgi:hypothetical protein
MAQNEATLGERGSVVLAQTIPPLVRERTIFIPYGRGYFESLRKLQGKDDSAG